MSLRKCCEFLGPFKREVAPTPTLTPSLLNHYFWVYAAFLGLSLCGQDEADPHQNQRDLPQYLRGHRVLSKTLCDVDYKRK